MKKKITLIAASAFLWLAGVAQTPCANDLNGFVNYKNTIAGTGSYLLRTGFEEKASQTYNYSGPGKVTSARVYGNYGGSGLGGVPLKVGVYNVDASGKPTTALSTVNHIWWSFLDNTNGFIDVTFPSGVTVNNRFAIAVEIINAFPYGNQFSLQYTGNGEGGAQDLASLAGTSTGNNWSSAYISFGKNGDFYLVPNMAHLNIPSFTTSSSCYGINSPISFVNTTQMSKDSMFNKIAFPSYSGGNTFYSWNFGDGSALSTAMNPTHAYTSGGVFTTTLTTKIEGWVNTCTKTYTRSVSVGLLVTATSISSVTCFGGNNGSFVASGQYGAPSYSYNINNGVWQTSTNFTGLTAGSYNLYIKDTKGCTNSTALTIIQPTGISIGSIISTNATCGNPTGAITATATGGIGSLQYKLDAGSFQATGSFSNLIAGTHTLTVKDANTCSTTSLVIVNDLGGPTMSVPNVINVSCFTGNDGSITLSSTGGTGLIQYSINGGTNFQTSGVFPNLPAGTYACIVKDNAGCTDYVNIIITQGPSLAINVSSVPVLCFGASNGQINATSNGGTGAHNYSINGVNYQVGTNFSGLAVGNYTVYVKDITSCVKTTTVNITGPSAITSTVSVVPESCNSFADASLTVTATGGNGGYSYSIDGTNFQGTGVFANLLVGTYTLTVKDVNNCTNTATATIVQPAMITTTVSSTNSTCTFTNGSLLIIAGGGSGSGYLYSINGGTSYFPSGSFSPLAAGTYYAIVKDGSGCMLIVSGTITDSNGPVITASSQQNVSCNGGNDGSITISNVVGGTGALQYTKNGINWQSSPIFTGLQAGTYIVQVKDANGCTGNVTKTITQPSPFFIASATASVNCYGNGTGSATITASGGAGFLAYSINGGGSFQSGNVFNNLLAGSYNFIVKDAANCMGYSAFTIVQTQPINNILGTLNVSCNGANDGQISVSTSGGVGPYLYSLNGVTYSSTNIFTGLSGNVFYTVYIKDANNCVVSNTQFISEPSILSISPTVNNISCAGGNNGAINLNVSGGVAPYYYQWSNGATISSLYNLSAGNYSVTVSDYNGCSIPYNITLNQPSNPLVVNGVVAPATNNSSLDGSINITVTGGSAPYTYSWSNGAATGNISSLNPGAYLVTITDANGCTTSSTFNVGNTTGIETIQINSNEIKLYPNPSNDYALVEANGYRIDRIELINLLGQKIFVSEVNDSTFKINTTNFLNGTYFVKVYINNISTTKKMTINK